MNRITCIYTERTYAFNQLCRSRLVGETRDGKTAPLLQGGLTLTVTDAGYELKTAAGGTVRMGVETDVFTIYDGTSLDLSNLTVIDELRDERTDFESYERTYGHNRVDRTDKRTFLVYMETVEDATAYGIIEHHRGKTLAIHSIYIPHKLSRKDRTRSVVEYVKALLTPTEHASITSVGLAPERLNMYAYTDIVRVNTTGYTDRLEEPRLLFECAAERKESIAETFDEPTKYEPLGLFEVENEGEKLNEKSKQPQGHAAC